MWFYRLLSVNVHCTLEDVDVLYLSFESKRRGSQEESSLYKNTYKYVIL